MDNGKVILGFLAGGAIGAILGILFAPDNGKNTRKKISKKSNKLVESLEDKFHEFADSMTGKIEEMMSDAEKAGQNGKTKAKELLSDATKSAHTNG
ncbi:MAG: YtxH domain-containing protein [Saprospiraceae bacterium]|nr:YtxH domain-containing protein [Saprospiraceae bacterium]